MTSKLTPYYPPPAIQSALLKKIPDSMPATSDLGALRDELEELKQISLARSKKAVEDIKAIEESMRRMKEREKGKAKALDKIKRERDCTCIRSNTRRSESLILTDDSSSLRFAHITRPRSLPNPHTFVLAQ